MKLEFAASWIYGVGKGSRSVFLDRYEAVRARLESAEGDQPASFELIKRLLGAPTLIFSMEWVSIYIARNLYLTRPQINN